MGPDETPVNECERTRGPQGGVSTDREAAARYGIAVGDIQDVVEAAIGKKNLSTTIERRKRFKPAERLLMQRGQSLRARLKHNRAHGFVAKAQRHHEQPRAPVLAGRRIEYHRPRAVVDLRLLRPAQSQSPRVLPAMRAHAASPQTASHCCSAY